MNNTMNMFDLLEAMDNEGNVNEEKLNEITEKENLEEVSNDDTKNTQSKKSTKKKSAASGDVVIEGDMQKYVKVDFKVFGSTVKILEGEELKEVKLKELTKLLVNMGFAEFYEGANYYLNPSNEEKTEATLVATYKFRNKG